MSAAPSAARPLLTKADLLRTLDAGTYTLPELYRLAVDAGLHERPGGQRIIQDGQEQHKRRIRSALQAPNVPAGPVPPVNGPPGSSRAALLNLIAHWRTAYRRGRYRPSSPQRFRQPASAGVGRAIHTVADTVPPRGPATWH